MITTYNIQDFFEGKIKLDKFHINKLEDMPPLPQSIKSPHKHKFVEVFLLKNGSMEHDVDFNQFVVQQSNLFFISEGQYHFWSKTNRENLSGYRLMFEESFLENAFIKHNFIFELVYLNNAYHHPLLQIDWEKENKLVLFFDLLYQEYAKDNFNTTALQANLFLVLLEIQRIYINENNSEIANSNHLTIYKNFCSLVNAHFTENRNITWYANQLNISQVQLNRIVNKYANNSIGQFIQNRRILESKRLLVTTSRTIQEIAFDIGFEDYSYFIRVFKKSEKTTPYDFRGKK